MKKDLLAKYINVVNAMAQRGAVQNFNANKLNNGSFISFEITPKQFALKTKSKVVPVRGGDNLKAKLPQTITMSKFYGTTKWSKIEYDEVLTKKLLSMTEDFAIITDKVTVIDYDEGVFSDEELYEISMKYFNGQPVMVQTSSFNKHCHLFFKGDTLNVGNKVKTFKLNLNGKEFNTDIRTKGGYCIIQNSIEGRYGQIRCFMPVFSNSKVFNLEEHTELIFNMLRSETVDFLQGNSTKLNVSFDWVLPKLSTPNSQLLVDNQVDNATKKANKTLKTRYKKDLSKAQTKEDLSKLPDNQITEDDYVTDFMEKQLQTVTHFSDFYREGNRNTILFTYASLLALKNVDYTLAVKELIRINNNSKNYLSEDEVRGVLLKVYARADRNPYGVTADNVGLVEAATSLTLWDRQDMPVTTCKIDYSKIDKYKDVAISWSGKPYIVIQKDGQVFKRYIKKDAHELTRVHADMMIEELTQAIKENRATLRKGKVSLNTLTEMYNEVRLRRHHYAKPVKKAQVVKSFALLKAVSDKLSNFNNSDLILTVLYNKMFNNLKENDDCYLNVIFNKLKTVQQANGVLARINKSGSFDMANHSKVDLTKVFTSKELRAINFLNMAELIELTQIEFNVIKGVYGGYELKWTSDSSVEDTINTFIENKITEIENIIEYLNNKSHNTQIISFESGSIKRALIKARDELISSIRVTSVEQKELYAPPQVFKLAM